MKLTNLQSHDLPIILAMGAIREDNHYSVPNHLPIEPFLSWIPDSISQQISPIKLTIELVPKTCWLSNVRSNVSSIV
jgi:hypothetical protein